MPPADDYPGRGPGDSFEQILAIANERHRALFRALLLLTPAGAKQLALLTDDRRP